MVSKLFSCVVVLMIFSISIANSLKILGLFQHPGVSHFHFFHPIMRGLADAGHDVTVVSHFPDKNAPANYKDLVLKRTETLTNSIDLELFSHRPWYQPFLLFGMLHMWAYDSCEMALNSTVVQNLLNTKPKYDVILMEQFNTDCMMGVAWKLKAPVIGLSSCILMPWHYDRFGSPWMLSHVTTQPMGFSSEMTYTERLLNFFFMNSYKILYNLAEIRTNNLARKYVRDENMPHLSELGKTTSMMFVNTHFSLEGPSPNPPTIVELGGIHIKEAKPLDADLKAILDSSKDGVIYVSWGSMIRADSLPEQKRNSLLKAFASMKQTVLWKWENETLADQPKNVHIRKWMPQRDILCHPNVRVFVSHGGLMGSSEAAYCGVPMVLTPIFGDQPHNAAVIKARGMGFIVHFEDITEETIKSAINEALKPTSLENAKRVSHSYQNRPKPPLETAIWWVEYVAATKGAPLLKSHSINMSTFTYYSFDVYLTFAIILIVALSPFIYLIWRFSRKSVSKNSKAKKE